MTNAMELRELLPLLIAQDLSWVQPIKGHSVLDGGRSFYCAIESIKTKRNGSK